MTRRLDISQWRDRTEEPVIVWVHDGYWELLPVAVDTVGPEADEYAQFARAIYAARAYYTFDEVCSEYADSFTADQIEALYSAGDWSAEREGLPAEWYAEGTEPDGSDTRIYVTEETLYATHRETLEEATPDLDPEDLEEIRNEIAAARAEYDC